MNLKRRVLLLSAVTLAVGNLSRAGPTLTTLEIFNRANGGNPFGGVVADASGNLYGTTYSGPNGTAGLVYELSGTNLITLATFSSSGTSGTAPVAGVVFGPDGNLYGTTSGETGPAGIGTAFELSGANHQTLTTLATFSNQPSSGITFDPAGNIFSTTFVNSSFFELSGTNHQTLITYPSIASFMGTNGSEPYGSAMVSDKAGNLYGTAQYGGLNNNGVAFELPATNRQTLIVLAAFNGTNGSVPRTGLTFDSAGNLYGTTLNGGINNAGTIFELSGSNHQSLQSLYSFGGTNGINPEAGVLVDAAGNLFGTTNSDGPDGQGTVFELSGTNLTTLVAFNGSNGSGSRGDLYADADGNLFGTTFSGPGTNYGSVFEVSDTGYVVPEPTGLCFMGLAGAILVQRRRSHRANR